MKTIAVCGKDEFPLTYGLRPLCHLAAHYNKKTTKVSGNYITPETWWPMTAGEAVISINVAQQPLNPSVGRIDGVNVM